MRSHCNALAWAPTESLSTAIGVRRANCSSELQPKPSTRLQSIERELSNEFALIVRPTADISPIVRRPLQASPPGIGRLRADLRRSRSFCNRHSRCCQPAKARTPESPTHKRTRAAIRVHHLVLQRHNDVRPHHGQFQAPTSVSISRGPKLQPRESAIADAASQQPASESHSQRISEPASQTVRQSDSQPVCFGRNDRPVRLVKAKNGHAKSHKCSNQERVKPSKK